MKNVTHQIDSKKEWLFLSTGFTEKFGLAFVLALEDAFSQRFHFKASKKSIGSKKIVLGIFKITLCLRDRHVFFVTIRANFQHFQYFNFETDFLENENLFQKTEVTLLS